MPIFVFIVIEILQKNLPYLSKGLVEGFYKGIYNVKEVLQTKRVLSVEEEREKLRIEKAYLKLGEKAALEKENNWKKKNSSKAVATESSSPLWEFSRNEIIGFAIQIIATIVAIILRG